MDYSDYTYSAEIQAAFFKAEAELLRLEGRLERSRFARYLKKPLLAIDAIFAIRISHKDITLPVVPLVATYDMMDMKHSTDEMRKNDIFRSLGISISDIDRPVVNEALHYMQTMNWISKNATSGFKTNMETVMRIHEYLLNGITDDERYSGFRKTLLPNGRGVDPHAIPSAVNELCDFINSDMFSPLGQASVIHHAFERIVPFDSMVDRTGLMLAFIPMFTRGLFANGYVVPICWGMSIDRERRNRILDSTRDDPKLESYREYRDFWASHNARNTFLAAAIANSFINAAEQIHDTWRSRCLQVQANSAIDRLLDLILANPCITVGYAAESIRKSYGATNEAMQQLMRAGIVRESVSHGRERVFVCDKSAAMMTDFVARLMKLRENAKPNEAKEGNFTHPVKDSGF